MSLKKLGSALAVVFALSAVLASSAFATATTTKGHWFNERGETIVSETVNCRMTSANVTLTGNLLGTPIKITASGVKCPESTIETVGSGETEMAEDEGFVEFTGTVMDEPAGCHVPTTLKTNKLKTKIYMEGGTVYDKFEPKEGNTFIVIPVEGCALAGPAPVTGTVFGRSPNATGVLAAEQPLEFSGAINATAGGTLEFAGAPAVLTGSVNNFLASGAEFAAEE